MGGSASCASRLAASRATRLALARSRENAVGGFALCASRLAVILGECRSLARARKKFGGGFRYNALLAFSAPWASVCSARVRLGVSAGGVFASCVALSPLGLRWGVCCVRLSPRGAAGLVRSARVRLGFSVGGLPCAPLASLCLGFRVCRSSLVRTTVREVSPCAPFASLRLGFRVARSLERT